MLACCFSDAATSLDDFALIAALASLASVFLARRQWSEFGKRSRHRDRDLELTVPFMARDDGDHLSFGNATAAAPSAKATSSCKPMTQYVIVDVLLKFGGLWWWPSTVRRYAIPDDPNDNDNDADDKKRKRQKLAPAPARAVFLTGFNYLIIVERTLFVSYAQGTQSSASESFKYQAILSTSRDVGSVFYMPNWKAAERARKYMLQCVGMMVLSVAMGVVSSYAVFVAIADISVPLLLLGSIILSILFQRLFTGQDVC